MLLQHDNARPYTSAATSVAIKSIRFEVVPHPPYSLDLTPSDLWLLRALKKHLRGKHCTCAVTAKWFWEQPNKFYSSGFEKLVQCWQHIKQEGDYVETWCIETKYIIWAILKALFHCNTLRGCKDTNMEAILLKHSLYKYENMLPQSGCFALLIVGCSSGV